MTFRQLLKRVVPVDAQTRARFDMGIRVLFYITCANVLVLFFVQGGYDVERCDWVEHGRINGP